MCLHNHPFERREIWKDTHVDMDNLTCKIGFYRSRFSVNCHKLSEATQDTYILFLKLQNDPTLVIPGL